MKGYPVGVKFKERHVVTMDGVYRRFDVLVWGGSLAGSIQGTETGWRFIPETAWRHVYENETDFESLDMAKWHILKNLQVWLQTFS